MVSNEIKSKVIVIDYFYSVKECSQNPNILYIFGDNLTRIGTGGQAQIRYLPNALGIATKYTPGINPGDYFLDTPQDALALKTECERFVERIKFVAHKFEYIGFPAGGLGTGLSKMPEKCPKLFETLNRFLLDTFEFDNTKGKLSGDFYGS